MKKILVTCVGSGVGQSVIDSLNQKREFFIIGCDGNPNVYAHSFCDKFYTVPGLYSEGYTDFILNLCIENKADILVPGHDHELVLFAKEYNRFKENGIEVLVSEPKLITISRDKQDWYDFFAPLGCKIVPTISVNEFLENPDLSIFPAIVKPSGGSASQGISIINELSDLEGLNGEDIIQPYLFPEESDKNYQNIVNAVKKGNFLQLSEISIQLIFNKDSKFSGIFISRNALKNGVPIFVDPINPDTFQYTDEILKFVPILEEHGVKGPVNIQGRVTPKGLFFFEMNMRFTGITGNRGLLGFNEVDYLVRNFLGLEATLEKYAYNKVGVRQVACTTITRSAIEEKETLTILGGGSTIGKAFILSNINTYKQINLIVRKSSIQKYTQLFSSYENVKLMLEDDIALTQTLCQTDTLVNFASALAFEEDELKFDAIRFMNKMTVKIAKAKINKVINISSQSVYPQTFNEQKNETVEVVTKNTYAFQKVMMEELFMNIKQFSPLTQVVSLRLPRVIAPNVQGQAGFFGKMIQDYKEGKTVKIDFPENNTNLIHVKDVVSAIAFVLSKMDSTELPNVLNVSGENISMRNYVELIQNNIKGNGAFEMGDSAEVKNSSMIDGALLISLGFETKNDITCIIKELE
ncbi:NAD-dependent epimerase/dehydratase family protein [Empedobacter falsenii]